MIILWVTCQSMNQQRKWNENLVKENAEIVQSFIAIAGMIVIIVMVLFCVCCWNLGKRSALNSMRQNRQMVQSNIVVPHQHQIQQHPQMGMNYPPQLPQQVCGQQQMFTAPPQPMLMAPPFVAPPEAPESGICWENQNDYHYQ